MSPVTTTNYLSSTDHVDGKMSTTARWTDYRWMDSQSQLSIFKAVKLKLPWIRMLAATLQNNRLLWLGTCSFSKILATQKVKESCSVEMNLQIFGKIRAKAFFPKQGNSKPKSAEIASFSLENRRKYHDLTLSSAASLPSVNVVELSRCISDVGNECPPQFNENHSLESMVQEWSQKQWLRCDDQQEGQIQKCTAHIALFYDSCIASRLPLLQIYPLVINFN
ncbi:hypothetical protein EGR_10660 [Echinococcus granulosus]|uniref:Uncharacterized protein n=1 Tax=Echinococcus granulosus TaxID=6210 RepID=W6U1S4_ECHGR|nr:hypothetical protein EGR_10660 [Echinococcus granulosus]EUB54476.1 hypothetical protein EGR_10660 [Echinococcus granulosus]